MKLNLVETLLVGSVLGAMLIAGCLAWYYFFKLLVWALQRTL